MDKTLKSLQEIQDEVPKCKVWTCENKVDLGYHSCKKHRHLYICECCAVNESMISVNGHSICQGCTFKEYLGRLSHGESFKLRRKLAPWWMRKKPWWKRMLGIK